MAPAEEEGEPTPADAEPPVTEQASAKPAEAPVTESKAPLEKGPGAGGGSSNIAVWIVGGVIILAAVGVAIYMFVSMQSQPKEGELSKANWDDAVAGKSVFIKFYAPWCGHCKKMKPAWDTLMKEYKNSTSLLVADVDCIGAGRSLCDSNGVKGFPTIKYGDPEDLQDYKGGRTLEDIQKFAKGIKPVCSITNSQLCTEEQRKLIGEFRAMTASERQAKIKAREEEITQIEAAFKEATTKLREQYKEAQEKKDADVKKVQESGLSILKAIRAMDKAAPKTAPAPPTKAAEL